MMVTLMTNNPTCSTSSFFIFAIGSRLGNDGSVMVVLYRFCKLCLVLLLCLSDLMLANFDSVGIRRLCT
jgi:hypothetical protein